ncbi:MAG TPA: hypothetical protein VLA59_07970 [Patescibacteria group bacterium]|nr:hypothetical protein [Patescibacteria group bacterium]
MTVGAVLEVAAKRSFASALDWPGWSRGGKSPDDALAALVAYAPRYAAVAARAGLAFEVPGSVDAVEITERLRGGSGTEFGIPSTPARAEEEPVAGDLDRLVALLRAAWDTFDEAMAGAEGRRLATGPRGGGRDLARIVDHVRDAEVAYLSKLGSRAPAASDRPPTERLAALRTAFVDALTAIASGEPVPTPSRTQKLWSPRYAVRRTAWHVLDHAWELQDRIPR